MFNLSNISNILNLALIISTALTIYWIVGIIKINISTKNYLFKIKQYRLNGDILATILWIFFLFINTRQYFFSNFNIWKYIFVINSYCIIFYFYRGSSNIKITENGFFIKESLIKWSDINSYKWTGLDLLNLKIEINKKTFFYKHKISYELYVTLKQKKTLDKLLSIRQNKLKSNHKITKAISN